MGEGVVQDDIAVAERALAEYDLAPHSALSLLNLSENATYAVDDAGTGTRSILRVHRQNYHLAHEIESELDWLDALRRDSDVTVPTVLPASDGRRVVTVNVDGTPRYVVHFEMVAGVEPDEVEETASELSFELAAQVELPAEAKQKLLELTSGNPLSRTNPSAFRRMRPAGATMRLHQLPKPSR